MIGLIRHWDSASRAGPGCFARALGLFAGNSSNHESIAGAELYALSAPRARPVPGWQAHRSPSGWPVLLSGWIDDAPELATALGLSAELSAEVLFGAAVERWGLAADSHVTGTYAAIVLLPDGRVRLSRSPLGGMPLFHARHEGALLACSIPRPIFAAGLPEKLRQDALLASLALLPIDDPELSFYEGLSYLPDGAVRVLSRDGVETHRWHDVMALPPTRFARDGDYVEHANELLSRAVGNALRLSAKPALCLSGGLDSALVGAEMASQLPRDRKLRTYTFHPLDEWRQQAPPAQFVDERPYVKDFLAMHPGIEGRFIDNRHIGYDHRSTELFRASGSAWPAMVLAPVHHGLAMAAADDGCDWLFNASAGNLSFSNGAPWAWREFLLKGQWRQLWQLAAGRPEDSRSVPRRIAAHSVLPLLPPGWRSALQRLVHGADRSPARNALVRADHPDVQAIAAASGHVIDDSHARSQRHWLALNAPWFGLGSELGHGYEQVFGLRTRDVTQYRPLLEFCFAIPTDQFVRDGETRWLARRMGEGRLPEGLRLNRRYGRHGADWFPRLTPRLAELREGIERLSDLPEIAPYIDIDRARHLLDNWPDEEPPVGALETELRFSLPSVLLMAQFVRHITGRN